MQIPLLLNVVCVLWAVWVLCESESASLRKTCFKRPDACVLA